MKIVAVAACSTGIAHTYMAKTAIEQECAKRGYQVRVETQGAIGIEEELQVSEVNEADVVLLAVAVAVEGYDRFEEKENEGKTLVVDPSVVIKNPGKIFDQIENL